jgi:putative transcriptional regulator
LRPTRIRFILWDMIQDYFKNQLLVAMPSLADIHFSQTVVYIEEHNEDGAIGLIINKPIDLTVEQLLKHLNINTTDSPKLLNPVYIGGPVAQDQGFVLHENSSDEPSPFKVSTSREMLTRIGNNTGPDEFIITLGYTGWAPGDLEREILNNDWLVVPANKNIILHTPPTKRWVKAAQTIGIEINQISDQTGHA